jgi:hypothetical protein
MLKAPNKPKNTVGLTIMQATTQARRIVDQTMPASACATVVSRFSHDLNTDTATVVTTITFPETADASDVACWAERAPGVIDSTWSTVRITITRKRFV